MKKKSSQKVVKQFKEIKENKALKINGKTNLNKRFLKIQKYKTYKIKKNHIL
jgi:hypothetical protein